jgi:hypothetical protein
MLDGLKNTMSSLQEFDFGQELEKIVTENVAEIEELQRQQLLKGKDINGEWIRPFYSENPYFKKPGAALKYAQWKQVITPNPERPLDVPNLYINGQFHNSLRVEVADSEFRVDSDDYNAESIIGTHTTALGLDEEERREFAENITLPQIKEVLREKTGFEIT